MRALQFLLILVAVLLFGDHAASARTDGVSPATAAALATPATVTLLAEAGGGAGPGHAAEDLQYLPKEGALEEDEGSTVGMLLIVAAVVVFGVIVVFVIRHHRSGRAG